MSIQSHSKPSNKLIIFSAEANKYGEVRNMEATNLLIKSLEFQGIDYERILGMYMGFAEASFMVNAKYLNIVIDLAQTFDQESILLLDSTGAHGTRKAHLQYMDGSPTEHIGWLRAATSEVAIAKGDYSYRRDLNQYWIVEPDYIKAGQLIN